jgi:hypothetical protein
VHRKGCIFTALANGEKKIKIPIVIINDVKPMTGAVAQLQQILLIGIPFFPFGY